MDSKVKKKLELFFKKYKLVKYKKGEVIYRPDEEFKYISYIKKGYVRMYKMSYNGSEKTIHIFKPLFYFSLIFAISEIPNKYYFEAVTDIELWRAPKRDVIKFIKSDSLILFELFKSILIGFRQVLGKIEYLISKNAYTKVASVLLGLSSRFGKKSGDNIIIDLKTSHRMIGSLTGIARETTTLQMDKLRKNGIIFYKARNIVITSIDKLKDEIAEVV